MTSAPINSTAAAGSDKDKLVLTAVSEISHIATLPQITLKIIKLVEDPNSSANDLNNVITHDPALGARILKVVNSAFYGLPGQVASINRAIVLLGLNAVKNIAIAASLAKLFRGGQISPFFNARDLWHHSIAVAAGSRLIAKAAGHGLPDEAFLAGLIHDLGIMVEIQARRMPFVEIMEKLHHQPDLTLRQAEEAVLGANHQEFGAALCKAWKFPVSFQYVTGHHHDSLSLPEEQRALACVVHAADIIAAKLKIGFTRSVEQQEIPAELLKELNLTPEQVDEISGELPQAIDEASGLLKE